MYSLAFERVRRGMSYRGCRGVWASAPLFGVGQVTVVVAMGRFVLEEQGREVTMRGGRRKTDESRKKKERNSILAYILFPSLPV